VLAAVLAAACGGVLPRTDPDRIVARIDDASLNEASGLAGSSVDETLFWALDDSGNPPVLHAFGTDGRFRGHVKLEGVANADWEALDAFEWNGRPWLLVADVGDNGAARPEVTLHVVPEPPAASLSPARRGSARPAWSVTLRLEHGPADCEAVAVDPIEERILLVTKSTAPPLLYAAPLRPAPGARVVARLETPLAGLPRPEIGPLELPLPTGRFRANVTGLAFSRDRRAAAILTYGEVYRFTRGAGESWAAALARPPEPLGAPGLWQAEAIAFARDGALYVTGEEPNPRLLRYAPAPAVEEAAAARR
jgi:hypothetical protein